MALSSPGADTAMSPVAGARRRYATEPEGRTSSSARKSAKVRACEPDPIVVRTSSQLASLEAYLLSSDRDQLAVALMPIESNWLEPSDVRAIVGPAPRIYLVRGQFLLRLQRIPGALALQSGSARIWWPGLTSDSDPADHPIVLPLAGESQQAVLDEFTGALDLSRPTVRKEIKRLQGALSFHESQLDKAIQELTRRARGPEAARADRSSGQ